MRLFLLFFLVAIFVLLLQTTLLHLLPISPVVPDLTLVLCVYLGLYHPTVGAALGAFLLGYSIDIVSSRIIGLNAFAMSLVFLTVYFSSRAIWLQNPLVTSFVVLFASLVKGVALVLVSAIFVSIEGFWIGAGWYIIKEALLAALLAPVVFALLRRGESYVEQISRAGSIIRDDVGTWRYQQARRCARTAPARPSALRHSNSGFPGTRQPAGVSANHSRRALYVFIRE